MKLFAGGGKHKPLANLIHKGMVLIGTMIITSSVLANPVLNNVAAGNATIHQTPNSTVINQASQKAIINWRSFNIGKTESTHFQQPAGGIALNRISATQGASSIYGRLTATGRIILVNPAGFFFGPSAFVNVGGLIASTADISDQNFLNGVYKFDGVSPFSGSIINQGQIIAAANGLIALLGNGVQNDGLIQAQLGQVVLASGKAFTMNFAGNDLISFSIDDKAIRGITNTGTILADGGTILVTAKTTQGVLDNVINMEGIVQARSLDMQNGEIIFSGDPETGVVRVAANVDASGKGTRQTGGNITVTGRNILLDNPAILDVSGDTGGGNIYIGGNYQGKGPLPNANAVVAMPNSKLMADAITSGHGGNVILWSDTVTRAYGSISARGGAQGGNGGFIETSGKEYLDVAGIKVDTRAPHGTIGTWLLDPSDLSISTDPTSDVTPSGSPTNLFTADNNSTVSTLNVDDLTDALGLTSVTVLTTGGGAGAGAGNIAVFAPIVWTSGTTLILSAFNSVQLLANIDGGSFIATSNNSGGATDPTIYLLATAVTTTGNQTYNGPVLLVATNTLTAGGDITFQNTLNSNDSAFHNLNISAGGTTTFNGAVGGAGANFALGSLIIDATGNTVINTTGITTQNDQSYGNAVTLGTGTVLTSTNNGNILFNSTLDSNPGAFNNLTVNTGGITFFGGIVGTIANRALGNLNTDAAGFTIIADNITTSGSQTYNDAVLMSGSTSITLDSSATNSSISFASTLDNINSVGRSLTLNTGSGDINLSGNVGSSDPLDAITLNSTGTTTLNGTVNTGSIATNAGGTTRINNNVTTTGTSGQVYGDNVALGADITLDANAGPVTFGGTINSVGTNRQLLINAAGDTTFNGTVGNTLALSELNTFGGGTTVINASSINAGIQLYSDAVILETDAVLTSTTGGNISFGNTLNSATNEFNDLTVNTAGSTAFSSDVGTANNVALGSLTTDAPGNTIINSSVIRTFDNQTHNDAVDLTSDVQLLNLGGGGAITFNSTVNGPQTLTLGSALNTVTTIFNGAVGNITPLIGLVAFDGVTIFNGPSVTTFGAQTYASSVSLTGNVLFTGVNIAFNNTLSSASGRSATIDDSGVTTFGSSVIGLGNLTTSGGGTTAINGGSISTGGTQTYNDNVTLGAATALTSSAGDIIFGGSVNGAFNLAINSAGTTTFGGALGAGTALNSLAITAANINMNGGAVTTVGNQTYNAPLTLGADAILTITNPAGAAISILQGINGNQNITLSGGTGNDVFSLADVINTNNVTINGGGGTNTLGLNTGSTQIWNLTGGNIGNVAGANGVTGTLIYNNIANLTGGAVTDNFILSGGTVSGNINGGSGNNSLTADNVNNTWNVSGTNTGTVTGVGGTFSNIQSLIGGTGDDNFVFANGAVVGSINGGSGGTNTLNISNYSAPVNITLSSTFSGHAAVKGALSAFSSYSNINTLRGDYTNDNITATGKAFTITFTSSREGFINDPINFFGFTVNNNSSTTVNVSGIIQQPTTNADDAANSPKTGTPLWLVLSDDTNSNLVDILNQLTEEYNETLNKVTINPTCFATN